uniref:Methylthioribulose-1-phosphate dehydratase n=1 Tax=Petromyzon marinus TaxID=7757 RepID=A0AAJ7SKF0_PETMA|nr:methylthioribulose-1-phosphate dehydratase isoform X1 [Petromyzon marinus]
MSEQQVEKSLARLVKDDDDEVEVVDDEVDADEPRALIRDLCRLLYHLGWATGTGGGVSIRRGDKIYMAPSGVQKERIKPSDVFELDSAGCVVSAPLAPLTLSQCAPLFMLAYSMRGAGCVIHTHSVSAVLATLLFPGSEFRIRNQEMIKGIHRGGPNGVPLNYSDTLVVPVIENTLHEADLESSMRHAMEVHPDTNAVLVRRHGVYVWGDTWQQAKTMCECYHYLFSLAVEMKRCGLDPDS